MEIGLILFLAFVGYWVTKSIKKNMYDPLDERIKKLENLAKESKTKKRNKYD
jgi:hypothetical protein